jgi:mRNA-degrading endonuclease RelE of RelBE toxin-antitoxin system
VPYQIDFSNDARTDLSYFTAYERKIIVSGIKEQLVHEPHSEVKNRKKLRDNPLANWELRIGKYRIFYEINEDTLSVTIISVGYKQHNLLFIRDKEVEL